MPDYLVTIHAEPAQPARERLVRAKNQAAALAHVVADSTTISITIDRASTDELIRLTKAGVNVETAA